MATVAKGTVADRPFAKTFFAVAAKRFTGELVLDDGGRLYRVAFASGVVCGAESPAPADSVTRIAATRGLANSAQLAELLRLAAADPRRDQVEILGELTGLPPEHLAQLRASCFAYRAMRLFALPRASFELRTESTTPREATAIDPRWVLFHGIKLHYTDERLDADLGPLATGLLRLSETGPAALPAFGLDEGEAGVAQVLAGYEATAEMLLAKYTTVARKSLLAMIHALGACGYLQVRAAPPAPAPRAAATTAAPAPAAPAAPATPAPATPAPATPAPATPAPAPRTSAAAAAPPAAPHSAPAAGDKDATASPRTRAPRPSRPPLSAQGHAAPAPNAVVPDGGDLVHRPRGLQIKRRTAPSDPAEIIVLITAKLGLLDSGADHFALLGISRGASAEELRIAFFTLAKQLHPDRLRATGIDDDAGDAHRLFAQINEAFNVLSSPERRTEYLRILAAGGVEAVRAQERAAESKARAIFEAEEHFQIGEMALRRNQYGVAVEAFQKALELNKEEGEHHAFLGWALWCSTQDKAGVERRVEGLFKAGLELSPNSVDATFYRALFAKQREGRDDAANWFHQVLKLRPEHAEAQLELSLMESRKNSPSDPKGGGLFSRLKR